MTLFYVWNYIHSASETFVNTVYTCHFATECHLNLTENIHLPEGGHSPIAWDSEPNRMHVSPSLYILIKISQHHTQCKMLALRWLDDLMNDDGWMTTEHMKTPRNIRRPQEPRVYVNSYNISVICGDRTFFVSQLRKININLPPLICQVLCKSPFSHNPFQSARETLSVNLE